MRTLVIIFINGLFLSACGGGPLISIQLGGGAQNAPALDHAGQSAGGNAAGEHPGEHGSQDQADEQGENGTYDEYGEYGEQGAGDQNNPGDTWLCDVGLVPAWTNDISEYDFNYGRQHISQPTGQGDLFSVGHHFGGVVFGRLRDGEVFRQAWTNGNPLALDADWKKGVFISDDQENLLIRQLPGEDVMHTIRVGGADGYAYNIAASLDSAGQMLTTADCEEVAEQTWSTVFRRYRLTGNSGPVSTPVWTHQAPGRCGNTWEGQNTLMQLPQLDAVLAIGLTSNQIIRLNDDGTQSSVDVFVLAEGEDEWQLPQILSVAKKPNSHQVFFTTTEGQVRVLDAQSMTFVEEHPLAQRQVAVLDANIYTYGPTTESPLAFSPSGDQVALTDVEGNVVVVDMGGEQEDMMLPTPFSELSDEEDFVGPGALNIPMAFSFSKRGILASFTGGFTLWSCDDIPGISLVENELSVQAPQEISARTQLTVTVENAPAHPAVFRLVNAVGNSLAVSLTRELIWMPWSEGEEVLHVEVDTGAQTYTSTDFTVRVLPAESP